MTQVFKGTAGSDLNLGSAFMLVMKIVPAQAGVINSISFTLNSVAGLLADIRGVIWSDSGTNPSKLLDWTAKTHYAAGTTGDKTQNFTQSFALVNGVTYWLGLVYDVNNGDIHMPADSSRTTADYRYVQTSSVDTVRDSPVANMDWTVTVGAPGTPGSTWMTWADQTTTNTYTFSLDAGAFVLTGSAMVFTRALRMALGTGVFTVAGSAVVITVGLLRRIALGTSTSARSGLAKVRAVAASLFSVRGVGTTTSTRRSPPPKPED